MKTKVLIMLWALGVCLFEQDHSSAQTRDESAHKHLKAFQDSELSTDFFKHLYFSDHYVTEHNGVAHYYFEQRFQNLLVYGKWWQIHLDSDGNILKSEGDLMEHLEEGAYSLDPALQPKEALGFALEHLGLSIADEIEAMALSEKKWIYSGGNHVERPIELTLEWLPLNEKEITLVYNVNILPMRGNHWWNLKIDANTGVIKGEYDWTYHCTFHNHSEVTDPQQAGFGIYSQVYEGGDLNCGSEHLAENGGKVIGSNIESYEAQTTMPIELPIATDLPNLSTASYKVYPFSVESPNHGFSSIVNNPWEIAGDAGTLGWHHDGNVEYNFLRGNNVYAKEDIAGNNGIGYSPSSSSFNFLFETNFSQSPIISKDAGLTNLFYWSNLNHDIWYQYGFDEQSGNFQNDNLDRGGEGNDYLFADGLDGEGTNNANFSVPPDGFKPRMQMYQWNGIQTEHLIIENPSSVAGVYSASMANFGAALPLSPTSFNGTVAVVQDATNPNTSLACGAIGNAAELNGKIAIVDRGSCLFQTKIEAVQNAGAIACVICNTDNNLLNMSSNGQTYTIPILIVSSGTCDKIKSIGTGLNIKLNRVPNVSRDASFDGGLVSHEYAHGISGRLTGGPMNPNCFYNEEQMSEGISDWMALILMTSAGDDGATPKGIGTYISSQANESKGLRVGYYSTNLQMNPTTYANLCDDDISVPHGVGYVWGSVLWDIGWAFIEQYGFDDDVYNGSGGNNMIMQLVIDALKLQNCNPGFVDARDALLLADQINNGGANQCLLWEVFAKRGLGYSANQGSTFDRCDGTAAFDMPPSCTAGNTQDRVKMKVILEGYVNPNSGQMTTQQNYLNLLGNQQPFFTNPWFYGGNESITGPLPANVVSWVLVELRNPNQPQTVLAQKAAFLRKDGHIVDTDNIEGVDFSNMGLGGQSVLIGIYQKNHLAILSSGAYTIGSSSTYDFTLSESQAMGNEQLKIAGSQYAMVAGDFDNNGVINNLDYNLWAQHSALINESVAWDGDGNGVINNLDFNLWYRNRSMLGLSLLFED